MRDDERAVSTALGYVLTLGISAVLITGLLIGGGSYVDGERSRATTEELRVHGERLAGAIGNADRLAAAASDGRVGVRVHLPDRVAGSSYAVSIVNASSPGDRRYEYALVLRAESAGVSVRIPVVTDTELVTRDGLPGGTFYIRCTDPGPLRVEFRRGGSP